MPWPYLREVDGRKAKRVRRGATLKLGPRAPAQLVPARTPATAARRVVQVVVVAVEAWVGADGVRVLAVDNE